MYFRARIYYSAVSIMLSCSLYLTAHAGGFYRPPCDDEHGVINSRKEDLDKCILKFEAAHKDKDRSTVLSLPEKDLRCLPEFKSLLAAVDKFSQCLEKSLWWQPKSK